MKATLTFPTRQLAEDFATDWSRKTLSGHTVGSGEENVEVSIYNITDGDKDWVDNYVANLNKKLRSE
mgnify:CR=1 FL=1